ncbi:MAG: VacB/RNase II family 3'-5' exoribonuclease [Bacteroidales bacterium]|jgi:ribonuclease R|nr:VacB/RNase II family 3'-5' exoribonuclease [Bacteroidales bacterium]
MANKKDRQTKTTRKDFRKVLTFTIDPDNAKDFDDALSFRNIDENTYEIGVHIADVSHFVREGSALDKEALERATSVYLVDRVVPMLPEELSNDICSLNPKEDKFCYSVIFQMNNNAEVLSYEITETIINSDRRFTYNEVQHILEEHKGEYDKELLILWDIAAKLREERFQKGAIDFAAEEVKFVLDKHKKPIAVMPYILKEANFLVEEFMLLANRTVAKHIACPKERKDKKTFVYRIHDKPDEEKMGLFQHYLKKEGYKIDNKSRLALAKSLNALFKATKDTPNSLLFSSIALKAMSKAVYSTDNIGHYGLGFKFYTHFTSPIRRYPDLITHRLLKQYAQGVASVDKQPLEKLLEHCSQKEKEAERAERESIKFKQAEFLLGKEGMRYTGVVSGVAKFGVFVILDDNRCEGLVPMENLTDDFYWYDEKNYAVRGRSSYGTEYKIGTKVSVKVSNVDLLERRITFNYLELI